MKTKIFAISCYLIASTSFAIANEPLKESTELQSREQSREVFQTHIDQDEIPALLQAMHREQFKHANMVRIQNIIEEAQEEGLPTRPLTNKVYEGIAKNVEEETITRAVTAVRNRYAHAYRQARELALAPQDEEPLGDLIARTNSAGLAEEDCDKIVTALRTRTRTMNHSQAQELTIQTMTTARIMAHRDVRSGTVSDVLVNALGQSYQASNMKEIQHYFMNRARRGTAENVAQQFATDINQGLNAQALGNRPNRQHENDGSRGSNAGSGGANSSGGSGGSGGSSGSSGGDSNGSSGGSGSSSSSGGSGGSGKSGGSSGGSSSGSSGGSGGGRGK